MRVIVWCLQVSVLVFMCGCRLCWHVQSPGRKREWNLGLGLPGAPQASLQHMAVVSNNQQSPQSSHPSHPSPEERESSKVQDI